MSSSSSSSSSHYQRPKYSYDKFDEHRDETPLGKLQQQYWTTKQHVIKKLGKKEDEFVVASDAELDSKLESFQTIAHSSEELLKIIEAYQDKLITLSVEEAEMSRFLKSQSTFDTRTRAGKMMSAVSKGQHFSSQQRTSLRLPLVRLANEVDTFRAQAIKDTLVTVRKMEQARTEYRGALLWMRNVSTELDPDTGNKLEKFRRVQAQVKRTKSRFDRLKGDVIQKIDLLAASRCNMFSHALVNYQQTLILFWQKTAKTMNAIADAFKGYQYYEFNIIKDLVEPSKRLAKMVNDKNREDDENGDDEARQENKADRENNNEETDGDKKIDAKSSESTNDDKLIDVNDIGAQPAKSSSDSLVDFGEYVGNMKSNVEDKDDQGAVDQLNELIDLMTMAEETRLSEQLKELEQLEAEKRQRMAAVSGGGVTTAAGTKDKSPLIPTTAGGLFSFMKKSSSSSTSATGAGHLDTSPVKQDLFELMSGGGLQSTISGSDGMPMLKSMNDLFSNANDEFEREWQSVFQSSGSSSSHHHQQQQQHQHQQTPTHMNHQSDTTGDGTISPTNTEFSLFAGVDKNLVSNLFSTNDSSSLPQQQQHASAAAKLNTASSNQAVNPKSSSNKQNWFDLFAELDPLKNPDAIGKSENLEEERNC